MSKFKNKAKEFFGLREQGEKSALDALDPDKLDAIDPKLDAISDKLKKIKDITDSMGLTETELDEAQLVNNITDYQGHVMYRLRDPQEAKMVAKDIMQWTNKKGFTIIKHDRSKTGLTGYFYFRLGEDPGTESQRIQGYLSQMPEIEKFVFRAPRTQ
jgi:hypothetical protein